MKKRILLLCAGGTIACRPTENGLVPSLTGEDLLSHMSSMTSSYEITSKDLFSLDSSNIQPEHWQQAARRIYEEIMGIRIEFFSEMHLKELPFYQALSARRLGLMQRAQNLMTDARRRWSA